jgi:cytidine deaminase
MDIDWEGLRAAATEVMRRAYAPYSKFPVGAAAFVDDGRIIVGCNVENASYGVTLCAECGIVTALHASGGGRLVALACVDGGGAPLMPCGRCRQLLWEHGGPECLVDAPGAPRRMAELLPYAFGVEDLDRTRDPLPEALREWRGRGTVFVHPDAVGGVQVWTAYWERSTGFGEPPDGTPPGILEEGPHWPTAAEGVSWARARTPRVVVVDEAGTVRWAGSGEPPDEVSERWDG